MIDVSAGANDRPWHSLDEMQENLRARFAAHGLATRFAIEKHFTPEIILAALRGDRPPADTLLDALGWERQIFYRRKQPCPCYRCAKERVEANPLRESELFLGRFDPRLSRYFLCETCGNKRCPHAADHRLPCTDSNEDGQQGSLYELIEAPHVLPPSTSPRPDTEHLENPKDG
jgi:hypothetical protein